MRSLLVWVLVLGSMLSSRGQSRTPAKDSSWKNIYRESYTKVNDLVHTKLDVKFDYAKAWMYGKAWITLKPHFYPTDSVVLDAKGMDISDVFLVKKGGNSKLQSRYDGMQLFIHLDKVYKAGESYTVYIPYTSKPNELKVQGSAAITDAKGLYFINPTGEEADKPTQIWTQGETEANSVWMPTIDKPNQKSTEEIYMTVPSKYVTLSNGLLISQKKNADGTRTDYWKMDLPHAPYLFFMGVGDFAIVKDKYKAMEVNYYVEKKYEPYARKIFGNTPEMIGFYEKVLGVPYQWPKYSQIVGRDYVSGAMENTTATLHQESAYQNNRQLVDGNGWEETIAHELFHQWFGDLVTAESWSNLTVNESFANYSEYLWDEHKYGRDFADEHNLDDMQGYLRSNSAHKNLVRYQYADKEDMFDAVSYNKGGRILHMLRNYVGDEAFFKSLNNYLMTNKFKTGEAAQLRLAFEEVTGKDLNWFWNQWYYGSGNPKVDIKYNYDAATHKQYVYVNQLQESGKVFRLPLAIDIYSAGATSRHNVWIDSKADTFVFDQPAKPDLVNVDADKVLLWDKTDNKSAEDFVFQYKHGPRYLDRKEALDFFASKNMDELALGLKDEYPGLRRITLDQLSKIKLADDPKIISTVEGIAANEKDKKTKASAISFLAQLKNPKYESLFTQAAGDSSYTVAGSALLGLSALAPDKSYELAKKYSSDAKGLLGTVIGASMMVNGTDSDFDFVAEKYNEAAGQDKVDITELFSEYLARISDPVKIKKGVSMMIKSMGQVPQQYRNFTDPTFKEGLDKVSKAKPGEVADYIKSSMN